MSKAEVARRNLKAELARQGLTQQFLADALIISRQAISARLRGSTPITVDELDRCAKALRLDLADLLLDPKGLNLDEASSLDAAS